MALEGWALECLGLSHLVGRINIVLVVGVDGPDEKMTHVHKVREAREQCIASIFFITRQSWHRSRELRGKSTPSVSNCALFKKWKPFLPSSDTSAERTASGAGRHRAIFGCIRLDIGYDSHTLRVET